MDYESDQTHQRVRCSIRQTKVTLCAIPVHILIAVCLSSWAVGVASFTAGEVHQCDAHSSLSVTIGDGRSARVWTDVWLPNGLLASLAPCLVKAISRAGKMCTVAEALNNRAWVGDIVGALTTQVLFDYICVWELVQDIVLQPLEPDRFVWKWTPNGSYSSSSTYRAFFNGSCELLGAVELWKTSAPPKVKFFFWLALHGRLWMAHCRQRHSLQDVDECALCAQESKTIDHLFVGRVYSRELWSWIFRPIQLQVAMLASTDSLMGWWLACSQELSNEAKKGFDSFLLLVTWSLWGERNLRVFRGLAQPPSPLLGLIVA